MTDAVFSNDTSQLITLSPDGKVKIWESTTGKLIPDLGSEFEGPPHYLHPNWFTLSNDAKLLAILYLPTITVWEVESGKQVQKFEAPRYTVHFMAATAFSLDCMFLAVTHDTFFQIWEIATRKMVHETLHQEHLSQVILSQDFKLAA